MKKPFLCVSLALVMLLSSCGGDTPPADTEATTSYETSIETQTLAQTESATQVQTEVQTEGETVPVQTFRNPILQDVSAPDPCVVYHNGYYYGTFTEALGISLYRSKNIQTLFTDEKILVTNLTDQIQGNVWAPELHYYPPTDRWYIYASGSTNGWEFGSIRMFCLESKTSDPFGEYEFKGYTDPDVLAIDQTIYYDEASQTLYTAYSEFTSAGQVITLAVMDNPWTISSQRMRLSYPRYAWEKQGATQGKDERVNEGPVFLSHEGKLCLIYSASGCWSEYYCLGLVEFKGKDGSVAEMMKASNWVKHSQPVFSAANQVYGVGHVTFFSSPDGSETWMAYHGMATPDAGELGRYAYVQKITFSENHLPLLGEPLPRETEIQVPSGEISPAE